ncbi:DUF5951 family protein [Intestinirhabdus alba]
MEAYLSGEKTFVKPHFSPSQPPGASLSGLR